MTHTAKNYGGALYDLAKEENLTEQILSDLKLVCSVMDENSDYLRLLCTPSVLKPERRKLIDEAWCGNIHDYTRNFLKLLCDNGALRELRACKEEFHTRYREAYGIIPVCAVSAVGLSDEQTEKLRQKLQELTGKTVELSMRVDEHLLGGIRLELPDRQLDGSVKFHLEQVQKLLKNTVL
ncbi:MAG: ATP synthase F1 subunit delta [Oscillospiraceae bacterium]|nr:ATP synthase F1 subunit delta [Oscillospiraceae bacterium]